MKILVQDKNAHEVSLVLLVQDEMLLGHLSNIAEQIGCSSKDLQQDFKADAKEFLTLYSTAKKREKIYLLGIGKKVEFAGIQGVTRTFSHRFKGKLPEEVCLNLTFLSAENIAMITDAAVSGLLLGLYNFSKFKAPVKTDTPVVFGTENSELLIKIDKNHHETAKEAISKAVVLSTSQLQIFDLVNAPSNMKTPKMMADFAQMAANEAGFKVKNHFFEEIKEMGLTALLAVNQGSPNTPAFILLEYKPTSTTQKTLPKVGLVGKGVTFDTGGISIKPSTGMQNMKSDMGGAAAVLGTFIAAAKLGLEVHLVGAIPATENMVDGTAAKPGDVFPTYSGKTIEITDTDAEGRVILADAIAYLNKNYQPDTLIDLATLTGSIIRAIGTQAAGLFTQNDALAKQLEAAGTLTGERLWRMPMWDEYGTDLKSDVADLRNFTGKPMSESISAAKFLEHFTEKHPAWVHLDIAGTAFGDSEFSSQKSATGFGIRLLIEYLISIQN
jgi:leucyl aminopeptidase